MKHRVAVGNIFTESNHLAGGNTTLADFERTELRRGADLLAIRDGGNRSADWQGADGAKL